jgi:hypothetical protein
VLAPTRAVALDHKNLEAGRPTRLDDAYVIPAGELALELGAGVVMPRRGPDRGAFPLELAYGAWPNLQLGLGTTLSTDPRTLDELSKSGDVRLSALYNLNQETLDLPAFGIKLGVELPTGIASHGTELELTGIVTRSVGRLSFHLNASYQALTAARNDERDGRYALALGASYPLGAPHATRTTLVADVFTEQAARHGEDNVVGVELGLRYQLTSRWTWDAGVGTAVAGPADRTRFSFTTGISLGF